jgi:hypothetical protein
MRRCKLLFGYQSRPSSLFFKRGILGKNNTTTEQPTPEPLATIINKERKRLRKTLADLRATQKELEAPRSKRNLTRSTLMRPLEAVNSGDREKLPLRALGLSSTISSRGHHQIQERHDPRGHSSSHGSQRERGWGKSRQQRKPSSISSTSTAGCQSSASPRRSAPSGSR